MAAAVERAGPDAATPTCPQWRVRDLVAHLGGVHRWATFHVTTCSTGPTSAEQEQEFFAQLPDEELAGWFDTGHAALVRSLREADSTTSCWTFLPAPSPIAFWARRQALETAVHRFDAEVAAGQPDTIERELALDGIDELLNGFLARRRSRLVSSTPRSLALRAADSEDAWTVRIEQDRRVVEAGASDADCEVVASASDLYLLLWNRRSPRAPEIELRGDEGVLAFWAERAVINWT